MEVLGAAAGGRGGRGPPQGMAKQSSGGGVAG